MAKMRMATSERPIVKLMSLQLLTTLGLNPAQVQLISGFIDTYLDLDPTEEAIFNEQLASIESQQEEVMQIVTSWMRQGLEQGLEQGQKQGELKLVMRLLNRRLGEITPLLQARIENLSITQLENLGEALLDFTSLSDLEAWMDNLFSGS